MKKMKSAAERLREVLCHAFAWLLFLLCLPFFLLTFSSFFLWKYGVIQVTKFFKTKLTLIFSSYDGLLAVEPFWETSRSSLALILIVDASINIEKFRDSFTDEILQPKSQILNSDGKPLFEKLMQIPVTFGGYYFWSKANYFLIHEHIRLVEQPMTSSQLKKFAGTVMTLPFPNKRPLWEILVFPNYKSDSEEKDNGDCGVKSAIVLRVHHAVADSWALMNLLHCMLTGTQPQAEMASAGGALTESYSFSSFPTTKKINFVLKLPLRVIKFYIDLLSHDDWFTTKHLESDEGFVSWTRVPHDTIQKIGSTATLGESTLSLTLFSGAFGKYISELQRNCPTLNKDGSDSKRDEAPETVRVCLPLTWMGIAANESRSNWRTATMAKIPLRKSLHGNNGPSIMSINTSVSSSFNSGMPQLISLYIYLLGLFPRHLLRYIMTWNNLGTNLIFQENPSFPALSSIQEDDTLLWGHKVEEVIPVYGFHWRRTALTVTTMKFKGDTILTFMSNADIMSGYQSTLDRVVQELLQKDLEGILQDFHDENGFISIPI